MPPPHPGLRFVWWNVQNFAHFDAAHATTARRPTSAAEAGAKADRVVAVIRALGSPEPADVIALGEVTAPALEVIRRRVVPDYRLIFPHPAADDFQIGILFRPGGGLRAWRLPIVSRGVPGTNRVMPVLDLLRGGHHCRFVFCHWPAFGDRAALYRSANAAALAAHLYSFLHDPRAGAATRHAVVVGDLNEEPFGDPLTGYLVGTRDRAAAARTHYTERDTRRVRLYNPSWRLLGERHAHPAPGGMSDRAGTCYHDGEWRTRDQVLVSAGLLTPDPPYFDETTLEAAAPPGCLGASGRPEPFAWNGGRPSGLSDHLPLVGRIALPQA